MAVEVNELKDLTGVFIENQCGGSAALAGFVVRRRFWVYAAIARVLDTFAVSAIVRDL